MWFLIRVNMAALLMIFQAVFLGCVIVASAMPVITLSKNDGFTVGSQASLTCEINPVTYSQKWFVDSATVQECGAFLCSPNASNPGRYYFKNDIDNGSFVFIIKTVGCSDKRKLIECFDGSKITNTTLRVSENGWPVICIAAVTVGAVSCGIYIVIGCCIVCFYQIYTNRGLGQHGPRTSGQHNCTKTAVFIVGILIGFCLFITSIVPLALCCSEDSAVCKTSDGCKTCISFPILIVIEIMLLLILCCMQKGRKPDKPTEFIICETTDTTITVSFVPGCNGGDVQVFILLYKNKRDWKEEPPIQETGKRMTYKIQELQNRTKYFVKMYAKNKYGNSEDTDEIDTETQGKPDSPKDIQMYEEETTDTTITISFVPGHNGGIEQYFIVSYKEINQKNWTDLPPKRESDVRMSHLIKIENLKRSQTYEVKMYAENQYGKSKETATIRTKMHGCKEHPQSVMYGDRSLTGSTREEDLPEEKIITSSRF